PSGSLAHWLGPKAEVPAGASSSDLTVEDVRFQNRVSFAVAGWARMIAATLSGIANFIVPPLARARIASNHGARRRARQRRRVILLAFAVMTLALPLAATADPLEVKVGVLRIEHSRE